MAAEIPTNETIHVFCIKTNQYAGNFERDMCGFCTGAYGECGVGEDEAAEFDHWAKETNQPKSIQALSDYTGRRPDDHGCHRPATMAQNAKRDYNDVWIFFERQPTDEQIAVMKERAAAFAPRVKAQILGFEVIAIQVAVNTTTTPV